MPQLDLSGERLELEPLFEADFSADRGQFVIEGGSKLVFSDGRMYFDLRESQTKHHYATVWCKETFEGDQVVEMTMRSERIETPGNDWTLEDSHNNLNMMLFGIHADGRNLLEDSASRTGDYPEYHRFPNYIYTYLGSHKPPKPGEEAPKTRVRFRKDPGFHLLAEHWVPRPIEQGRDYRFTVVIQGLHMRFFVNSEMLFDYEDRDCPHRKGLHGYRTFKSKLSTNLFRVSRIVG